jgi:methionyl-tRNA formyltransferase
MRVVQALDAGPMLAAARCPIGADETSVDVEQRLATIGAGLLVTIVDDLADGRATDTPQDEGAATYAHRLTREDGTVDWTWPAARVHNLIRGLHPWPHAFAFCRGQRLILIDSTVGDDAVPPDIEPGTILEAHGDRLLVATGRGALRITRLQAEGTRAMTTRDFLPGHPMSVGDRLTSSP